MATTGQSWATITKVLKDFYLPAWINSINLETSALITDIKHIPVNGNKIVAAAEIGANGGFGFGVDGEATPKSGRQMFDRFEETTKDVYCNIEISDKTVKQAQKGGNIIDPLNSEIQGAFKTSKYHLGRSVYGNGQGVLAFITAGTTTTATVNTTKYLTIGSTVDLYKGTPAAATDPAAEAVRIVNIDRAKNIVTFDAPLTSAVTSGFITLQNSFNRELTGLGAIFDSSITTLYGLDKADHYHLNPIMVDAKKDISDTLIRSVLRDSTNYNNGNVDMLMCGDKAYDTYAEYLRLNGYRVEDSTLTLKGGFKAIKFLNGSKEVSVVNDKFVPDTEMWGFNKASLAFHDLSKWDYVEHETGGIFTLVPGTSMYRALLACYTNILCAHPGGCVRIYNVCDGDGLEKVFHNK